MNKIERSIKEWNEFRIEHSDVEHTREEWIILMRDAKLLYYCTLYPRLKDEGILEEFSSKLSPNGSIVPTFMFTDRPIHKSLLEAISKSYKKERQEPKEEREDKVITSPEAHKLLEFDPLTGYNLSLKGDAELVNELRIRGYEISATKTVTVNL